MVYLRGNGLFEMAFQYDYLKTKQPNILTVTERAERKISTVKCNLKINAASPWFYPTEKCKKLP